MTSATRKNCNPGPSDLDAADVRICLKVADVLKSQSMDQAGTLLRDADLVRWAGLASLPRPRDRGD